MKKFLPLIVAPLALVVACQSSSEPAAPAVPAAGSPSAEGLPAGHPAIGSMPSGGQLPAGHPAIPAGAPSMAAADPAAAKGLTWTDVPGWQKGTPSSSMRVAQYAIPKTGADTEDAEMVVFHFGGGQGGSVDSNIKRWVGQFGATEPGKTEKKTIGTLPVTVVSVEGTYAGGMPMMQGGAAPEPKANWAMVGAIAEAPSGPWFFKLTGPKATVASARAGFDKMVASFKTE